MENILTMLKSTRLLVNIGWLFLLSALAHAGVWAWAGFPSLEGPVSWRKPMTFGFSTGVLFLSLAWVMSLLPATRARVWQARVFSVLLVAEIGLIDMQQWRGVASHFNNGTPFDAAVFTTMGVLILSASVIIAVWTREVLRQPLATTPALAMAARVGMVMLNVGNVVGLVMAMTQSTTLKPMHGIALHVIQALPVAVWFLAWLGYPRAWRFGMGTSPSS